MKVVFHPAYYQVYTSDPAAEGGRLESIVEALGRRYEFVEPAPASSDDIAGVHSEQVLARVRSMGLFDVAALAAGGAVTAAELGLDEPAFALIRPPGHHASPDNFWGFCYFNNMAVALRKLKREGRIDTAFVLDFDLHYGDGTVNCLGSQKFVDIFNPSSLSRDAYLTSVKQALERFEGEMIAISAGFDNHEEDWGGLLRTEDYREMGKMTRDVSNKLGAGLFAILEGGYNHDVLGENVCALLEGMEEG